MNYLTEVYDRKLESVLDAGCYCSDFMDDMEKCSYKKCSSDLPVELCSGCNKKLCIMYVIWIIILRFMMEI